MANAIHVWGIARAFGGAVLLRLEDHDRTRCTRAYELALLEDLEWLGFEADIAPIASYSASPHEFRQSDHNARYERALAHLANESGVYVCRCTRKEIAALIARAPGEELRYPGTCRDANVAASESFARRVRMHDAIETFTDLRLGEITQRPARQCGDVLLRDRHCNWTYQFAVTVDDMMQGIDVIIRGEDLLASTGRQRQLARMLGRASQPRTLHHGLLTRADGTKLSKSHGDLSVRDRRRAGATPAELLGEAAHLMSLQTTARTLTVRDLPELFDT